MLMLCPHNDMLNQNIFSLKRKRTENVSHAFTHKDVNYVNGDAQQDHDFENESSILSLLLYFAALVALRVSIEQHIPMFCKVSVKKTWRGITNKLYL